MKDINLLVWLTQLGLSVALPLAGFLFAAVWLRNSCGWGNWVIWAGVILGLSSAVGGFRNALRAMESMSGSKKPETPPHVSNEHT